MAGNLILSDGDVHVAVHWPLFRCFWDLFGLKAFVLYKYHLRWRRRPLRIFTFILHLPPVSHEALAFRLKPPARMSTFHELVADLTRDAERAQPKDALQFCASWFQSRLEEQRTRIRDVLSRRPSLVASLPADIFVDTPHIASSIPSTSSNFTDPFYGGARASLDDLYSGSPFTNPPHLGDGIAPSASPVQRPTFRFNTNDSPSDPLDRNSFNHTTPGPSPAPNMLAPYPPTASHSIYDRRSSISAEPILVDQESDVPLPVYPKTEDQLQRIRAYIAPDNFIFWDLDEEQLSGVLNAMKETHVKAGTVVIRQGDQGDYFYVVESGLLHCFIADSAKYRSERDGHLDHGESEGAPLDSAAFHPNFGNLVQKCEPGSSFGELALMYGHPRAASVVAIQDSTLWSLDRITFRTIILKAAHRRRTLYEHFLSGVPLLTSLSATERSKVADALVSKVYQDGEAVVKEGDIGDTFFFVEEGQATVTKSKEGEEIVVGDLSRGDYFGGRDALLLSLSLRLI